jgi:hypothetical protein
MATFSLSLLVICIMYLKHTNKQASARITFAIQVENDIFLYYNNSFTGITIHTIGHMHLDITSFINKKFYINHHFKGSTLEQHSFSPLQEGVRERERFCSKVDSS